MTQEGLWELWPGFFGAEGAGRGAYRTHLQAWEGSRWEAGVEGGYPLRATRLPGAPLSMVLNCLLLEPRAPCQT